MIALLLACTPAAEPPPAPAAAPAAAPVEAVDRWAQVVALATPEVCGPAPAALAEALARDTRDPEEIRVHLAAWHAAQPDGVVRFDGPAPVAGMNGALAWSDWILDGELPAWVHLLSSLDRCGDVRIAGVMASHADRLCSKRGAAFVTSAKAELRFTPIHVLAAREAVAQVAAAGAMPPAQLEDLRRYLEAWILDGNAGPLPPVERGTRPLVATIRSAMDQPWALVLAKRAATDACLAGAP